MAYCPECGTEVGEEAAYCRDCGNELTAATNPESAATQTISEAAEPTKATSSNEEAFAEPSTTTTTSLPPPDQLRTRLQGMDDYEFEHFIADLWARMGWETEVSQASNDAGIDVIAEKKSPYPQKKLIQAKRYSDSTTVGGPDIQQYASLRHQDPDTDSVVVVTTSRFTNSGQDRAKDLNVKTVDGDDLVGMIEELDAADLVQEYIGLQTVTGESAAVTDTTPVRGEESRDIDVEATSDGMAITDWNRWHWVAAAGGILAYASVGGNSPGAFGVLLLLTGLTMYLDIRHVRKVSDWSPRAYLYLGGLIFGLLSLPVYLVNRMRLI